MITYPLLIAGAKSTGVFTEIRSPYDGSPVAKVEKADKAALSVAIDNADRAFREVMRGMPAWQRAEILYKTSESIKANIEELALIIASEGGKPLRDARVEATRAVNTVKMAGDEALQLNGEQLTMDRSRGTENHLAFTVREPIGPVLAISAFNHPLNLTAHLVATAIAAGCSVVVKPASQTPVSCLRLAQFLIEAGLPAGAISVATAGGAEIDAIVGDPRFRFVNFIGGGDVGWALRGKIAPGTRLALEHGGTGTAIVDASADLAKAIPSLLRGGFYHAGQVCVSTQIVEIHESIYDQALELLKAGAQKLVVGDPRLPETEVGPLINTKELDRLDAWIGEAVGQGAKIIIGGKRLANNCYEPTILAEVTSKMRVMQDEIFGPVIVVRKFKELTTAIATINASPFAFQAAVYAQDLDRALLAARSIEAKAVMINDSTAFRVDWMPFAGGKTSGLGVGGMRYAVHEMTEEKLIVVKVTPSI
jgi:acyl-CoA reductase-like NAD-dependent aldehyde dehydrogenase